MINKIQIIVLLLSISDIVLTGLYIHTFHKKFPDLDYTVLEANPIIKLALKRFSIPIAMIIGGLITFSILTLLILSAQDKWHYFFLGALMMMNIYHFLNFSQLIALKGAGG